MKYICLGYMEPGKFEGMTEDEQHGVMSLFFQDRTVSDLAAPCLKVAIDYKGLMERLGASAETLSIAVIRL